MSTFRNRRKLAAVNRDSHEENPRNYLSEDTQTPTSNDDFIRQALTENERVVTRELSEEFNRLESLSLGASLQLHDFLPISYVRVQSRSALGISRDCNRKKGKQWKPFAEWSSSWCGYFGKQIPVPCDFRAWPSTSHLLPTESLNVGAKMLIASLAENASQRSVQNLKNN